MGAVRGSSPAARAPSPVSTGTPSRKNSSTTHPPSTSAGRAWTTSRTRQRWTATSSAPCPSRPASAPPAEHPLISLLALNGLRVSEATGADIEALGIERGHRTLVITRKGGKVEAASHADPRTTMRHDRARASLDRHATYIVAAYVAGAAR